MYTHNVLVKRFFKAIAFSVSVFVFFSAPAFAVCTANVYTSELPEKYAEVRSRWKAPVSESPLILHLQDAHTSFTAQKNIAETINLSVRENESVTVCAEGAAGEFALDDVSSFPFPDITEKSADMLLKKGRISGVEYAGIKYADRVVLKGAEDRDLYCSNYQIYRKVAEQRDPYISVFDRSERKVLGLVDSLSNPDLKESVEHFFDYRQGHISFSDHVLYLIKNNASVLENGEFHNLMLFSETLAINASVSMEDVSAEISMIVDSVSDSEKAESEALRSRVEKERRGEKPYYDFLKAMAIKYSLIESVPSFNKYCRFLSLLERVDMQSVVEEADRLFWQVSLPADNLTDFDASFLKALKISFYGKKFLMLEALACEVDMLQAERELFSEQGCVSALTVLGLKSIVSDLKGLDHLLDDVLRFYDLVEQRNDTLVNNAVEVAKKEGRSVLVTGGYHTSGITARLRQLNASYIVASPKIVSTEKDIPYNERMLLFRTPFEKTCLNPAVNTLAYPLLMSANPILNADGSENSFFTEGRQAALILMYILGFAAFVSGSVEDEHFDKRFFAQVSSKSEKDYIQYLRKAGWLGLDEINGVISFIGEQAGRAVFDVKGNRVSVDVKTLVRDYDKAVAEYDSETDGAPATQSLIDSENMNEVYRLLNDTEAEKTESQESENVEERESSSQSERAPPANAKHSRSFTKAITFFCALVIILLSSYTASSPQAAEFKLKPVEKESLISKAKSIKPDAFLKAGGKYQLVAGSSKTELSRMEKSIDLLPGVDAFVVGVTTKTNKKMYALQLKFADNKNLEKRCKNIIRQFEQKTGIDSGEHTIRKESNFEEGAVSHSGAVGLVQLMPDTVDGLIKQKRESENNLRSAIKIHKKYAESTKSEKNKKIYAAKIERDERILAALSLLDSKLVNDSFLSEQITLPSAVAEELKMKKGTKVSRLKLMILQQGPVNVSYGLAHKVIYYSKFLYGKKIAEIDPNHPHAISADLDPELAAEVAYNCGIGYVTRAIKKHKWENLFGTVTFKGKDGKTHEKNVIYDEPADYGYQFIRWKLARDPSYKFHSDNNKHIKICYEAMKASYLSRAENRLRFVNSELVDKDISKSDKAKYTSEKQILNGIITELKKDHSSQLKKDGLEKTVRGIASRINSSSAIYKKAIGYADAIAGKFAPKDSGKNSMSENKEKSKDEKGKLKSEDKKAQKDIKVTVKKNDETEKKSLEKVEKKKWFDFNFDFHINGKALVMAILSYVASFLFSLLYFHNVYISNDYLTNYGKTKLRTVDFWGLRLDVFRLKKSNGISVSVYARFNQQSKIARNKGRWVLFKRLITAVSVVANVSLLLTFGVKLLHVIDSTGRPGRGRSPFKFEVYNRGIVFSVVGALLAFFLVPFALANPFMAQLFLVGFVASRVAVWFYSKAEEIEISFVRQLVKGITLFGLLGVLYFFLPEAVFASSGMHGSGAGVSDVLPLFLIPVLGVAGVGSRSRIKKDEVIWNGITFGARESRIMSNMPQELFNNLEKIFRTAMSDPDYKMRKENFEARFIADENNYLKIDFLYIDKNIGFGEDSPLRIGSLSLAPVYDRDNIVELSLIEISNFVHFPFDDGRNVYASFRNLGVGAVLMANIVKVLSPGSGKKGRAVDSVLYASTAEDTVVLNRIFEVLGLDVDEIEPPYLVIKANSNLMTFLDEDKARKAAEARVLNQDIDYPGMNEVTRKLQKGNLIRLNKYSGKHTRVLKNYIRTVGNKIPVAERVVFSDAVKKAETNTNVSENLAELSRQAWEVFAKDDHRALRYIFDKIHADDRAHEFDPDLFSVSVVDKIDEAELMNSGHSLCLELAYNDAYVNERKVLSTLVFTRVYEYRGIEHEDKLLPVLYLNKIRSFSEAYDMQAVIFDSFLEVAAKQGVSEVYISTSASNDFIKEHYAEKMRQRRFFDVRSNVNGHDYRSLYVQDSPESAGKVLADERFVDSIMISEVSRLSDAFADKKVRVSEQMGDMYTVESFVKIGEYANGKGLSVRIERKNESEPDGFALQVKDNNGVYAFFSFSYIYKESEDGVYRKAPSIRLDSWENYNRDKVDTELLFENVLKDLANKGISKVFFSRTEVPLGAARWIVEQITEAGGEIVLKENDSSISVENYGTDMLVKTVGLDFDSDDQLLDDSFSISGLSDNEVFVFIRMDSISSDTAFDLNDELINSLEAQAGRKVKLIVFSDEQSTEQVQYHLERQGVNFSNMIIYGSDSVALEEKNTLAFFKKMRSELLKDRTMPYVLIDSKYGDVELSSYVKYTKENVLGWIGLVDPSFSYRSADALVKSIKERHSAPATIGTHLKRIFTDGVCMDSPVIPVGDIIDTNVKIANDQMRERLIEKITEVNNQRLLKKSA